MNYSMKQGINKYMKISPDGKIAYHVLRFREGGGVDFVQYDFDGTVEYVEKNFPIEKINTKYPPLTQP